jgi:hypothetical protein
MARPTTRQHQGTGWVILAGVVLAFGGAIMLINGLWALTASTTIESGVWAQLFRDSSLDTWGWFYVILGPVVLIAGICVFFRMEWARWAGISVVFVQAFFAFFWIFTRYWPTALLAVAIDLLVMYALASHGTRATAWTATASLSTRLPPSATPDSTGGLRTGA